MNGAAPSTANQYISHIVKGWVETKYIRSPNEVRTAYLASIVDGFTRQADVGKPLQDRASIPMTYPLVLEAVKAIDRVYAEDYETATAMRAAFAIGFGCSLRPGEYLKLQDTRENFEQLCAGNVHFWWGDYAIPETQPERFPNAHADRLSMSVDFLKNDPRGKACRVRLHERLLKLFLTA